MKLNSYLLRSAIVASLGGLLFGFDTAVISGTTRALTETYHLSSAASGCDGNHRALWAPSSAPCWPAFRATASAAATACASWPILYLVSALGCAFAWNWMRAGRLSFHRRAGYRRLFRARPDVHRGTRPGKMARPPGGPLPIQRRPGNLAGLLFELSGRRWCSFGADEWRWKFARPRLPAALFFLLLVRHPAQPALAGEEETRRRSPRSSAHHRRGKLRGRTAGHRPVHRRRTRLPAIALFSWKYRFPIFLAVSIGMFNQLSGINAILYYINDIFYRRGLQQSLRRPASGSHRRHQSAVHHDRHVRDRPHRPQDAAAGGLGRHGRLSRRRRLRSSSLVATRICWSGCWSASSPFSRSRKARSSGSTSAKFSPTRCAPKDKAWAAFRTGS